MCPVCLERVRGGVCQVHGPWERHQLVSSLDRRCATRHVWRPFEPLVQACPRCLGDVAETRAGFECVDHAHGRDSHGPYQVDELLGPSAQRDGAAARERDARARDRERVRSAQPRFTLPDWQLPNITHVAQLTAGAAVVATTLYYLAR
jgi:hypothetical protein